MSDKENIDAIYEYVRGLRPKWGGRKDVALQIASFEGWYQSLTPADLAVGGLETAKRRRDVINKLIGEQLPPTYNPADGAQTPPNVPKSVAEQLTDAVIDTAKKAGEAAGSAAESATKGLLGKVGWGIVILTTLGVGYWWMTRPSPVEVKIAPGGKG